MSWFGVAVGAVTIVVAAVRHDLALLILLAWIPVGVLGMRLDSRARNRRQAA